MILLCCLVHWIVNIYVFVVENTFKWRNPAINIHMETCPIDTVYFPHVLSTPPFLGLKWTSLVVFKGKEEIMLHNEAINI
jgi:hypothetical protein